MLKVNGEAYEINEILLTEFLASNGYEIKSIAVECNEIIVPKAEYEGFVLRDGDRVEIVSLVGGG